MSYDAEILRADETILIMDTVEILVIVPIYMSNETLYGVLIEDAYLR